MQEYKRRIERAIRGETTPEEREKAGAQGRLIERIVGAVHAFVETDRVWADRLRDAGLGTQTNFLMQSLLLVALRSWFVPRERRGRSRGRSSGCCSSRPRRGAEQMNGLLVAGGPGFEPGLSHPKCDGLPLADPPPLHRDRSASNAKPQAACRPTAPRLRCRARSPSSRTLKRDLGGHTSSRQVRPAPRPRFRPPPRGPASRSAPSSGRAGSP